MKFITFLRAEPQKSGAHFQRWYAEDFSPSLAQRFPGITSTIVNLTEEAPAELRLSYDSADPLARYDVVAEMTLSGDEYRSVFERIHADLAEWADIRHTYRVSEAVVLDKQPRLDGVHPGIKFFRELFFYADMSDEAVKRCWAHHANLALKVHIGATRYVRHWVEERIGRSTPHVRGIVEFYFPTREDLVERYYESPRGRDQIIHDTGHFIERRLPRAYVREFSVTE